MNAVQNPDLPEGSPSPDDSSSPSPALGGRSVLLTGATGFIGRHLARRLVRDGARLVATSRRSASDNGAAPEHGSGEGDTADREPLAAVDWRQLDLGDAEAVQALVDEVEPEVVLHLASYVAGSRSLELVLPTFRGNLASSVNLLTACQQAGCLRRFVQVGSLEEPDPGQPAPVPSSPYAAAKAAAAAYARMFHQLYETPVTLARLFMVYGPGRQDENKLVPYVVRSLLDGRDPSLSSGVRPVDWIHVDDVVEGLVRLAGAEGVDGQRVDLGTGVLTPVRGVVELLYRQLAPERAPSFGALGDRKAEQVRRADVEQTRLRLGWQPTIELESGLARTVEWFLQH